MSLTAATEPVTPADPSPIMVAPFVLLLLAIALGPFLSKQFWERNYRRISLGLGCISAVYYVLILHNTPRMLSSLIEYAGFMALISSLFIVAGGIHIRMTGRATPGMNAGLLALGALLANVIGTTGASMLLIRPYLRINKYRLKPYHVVFFIFIVSNIGGALTPIGDPPLFLGYLKGVPFFWLLKRPEVVAAWMLCIALLLAIFAALDIVEFQNHHVREHQAAKDRVELQGSHNFLWLAGIVGLVLAQKGDWVKGLREQPLLLSSGESLGWTSQKTADNFVTLVVAVVMIGTAALSYRFANKGALKENQFSLSPVREVGFLFVGIFATMVPALDLLERHAADLGIHSPRQFFWASGSLSSVLDNAPTYMNFLAAAFGLHHLSVENPSQVSIFLGDPALCRFLVAVSLGSVFFGANTYIGNGPNFMVKSIAESAGADCPGFFGYIFKYTIPILLPLFFVVSWLIL